MWGYGNDSRLNGPLALRSPSSGGDGVLVFCPTGKTAAPQVDRCGMNLE